MTDERACDIDLVTRPHEILGDRGDRLQLAVTNGDTFLRLERPADPTCDQPVVSPAHEQEGSRDDRQDDRDQRQPDVADDRPLLAQDEHAEDRCRSRNRREDEHDAPVDQVRPRSEPPELGQHRARHGGVRGREHEQRDRVEEHRFGGVTHRAKSSRAIVGSWKTMEPAARGDDTAGSS